MLSPQKGAAGPDRPLRKGAGSSSLLGPSRRPVQSLSRISRSFRLVDACLPSKIGPRRCMERRAQRESKLQGTQHGLDLGSGRFGPDPPSINGTVNRSSCASLSLSLSSTAGAARYLRIFNAFNRRHSIRWLRARCTSAILSPVAPRRRCPPSPYSIRARTHASNASHVISTPLPI